MIDNYGRILFGFQIREDEFYNKLEENEEVLQNEEHFEDDVVEWFDDTYLYDSGCDFSKVNYINDPMIGETGFFGVILHSCDLEEDYDDAIEIPLEINIYLETINDFANRHKVLYRIISECAVQPTPRMLFAITKF